MVTTVTVKMFPECWPEEQVL